MKLKLKNRQDFNRSFIQATVLLFILSFTACESISKDLENEAEISKNSLKATSAPVFSDGDVIALKSHLGYYVSADRDLDAKLIANRDEATTWEMFEVEENSDGTYSFLAWNGYYVCADSGTDYYLIANRNKSGKWERFELEKNSDGTISLLAWNDLYVCADAQLGDYLVSNRSQPGSWESFKVEIISEASGSNKSPASVLGISEKTWKINSFVGNPSEDPIYYDDITDSGADYNSYSDDSYFYTDEKWVYFKCYRGLGGSKNSDNPRVELREMDGSGKEKYWTNEGTNTMEWTVKVNQLSNDANTKNGVTCVGQIHGPGSSVDDIIRVQFYGTAGQSSGNVKLKISGYITEDVLGSSVFIDNGYQLDKEYTMKLQYNSDDYVKLYVNGSIVFSQKMDTDKDENYFKVGNYVQSSKNTDYDGSYCLVAVKNLSIVHN